MSETKTTSDGQADAIAAAMRGRAPRADEQVCAEPDIYNAPYMGLMVRCKFQHRHRGPHSWVDDPMGPRHPEARDQAYAEMLERHRRRFLNFVQDGGRWVARYDKIPPFFDPRSSQEWRERFPYRSEDQRAADYAAHRASERARP